MFQPPYPPYDPTDVTGFSYETVLRRWPYIITGIVNQVYNVNHDLTIYLQSLPGEQSGTQGAAPNEIEELREKIEEGKKIIEKAGFLKYSMGRDQVIERLQNDSEDHIEIYNSELERLANEGKNTWFKAPWLFAECFLYRLFRTYFTLTKHWRNYDPFFEQKMDAFKKSGNSIYKIAATINKLSSQAQSEIEFTRNVVFKDMLQICLWGNATDLSLLTQLSEIDIATLQRMDVTRNEFILRDDQDTVWDWVRQLNGARMDIVLDNAGFELFTDLVLADFLVTFTPYVSKVVFHPKQIPWFVSDVTPNDFDAIFKALDSPLESQSSGPGSDILDDSAMKALLTRFRSHLKSGVFSLADPTISQFWTTPWPYWDMETRAPQLWKMLNGSGLVIFKGDLNYRKLTGDIRWPASAPFGEAIGPLAGSFPILSLRTNKADVVVGIDQGVADKLDQSGEKWRVDGRYALVSFLPPKEGYEVQQVVDL